MPATVKYSYYVARLQVGKSWSTIRVYYRAICPPGCIFEYLDKAGRLPTRAITAAFIFGEVRISHSYRFITALLFLLPSLCARIAFAPRSRYNFASVVAMFAETMEIAQNPPLHVLRLCLEEKFRTLLKCNFVKMCVTRWIPNLSLLLSQLTEASIFHRIPGGRISEKGFLKYNEDGRCRRSILAATAKLPVATNNESVRLRFISTTVPSQRDENKVFEKRWLSFLVLFVSLFSSIAYVMKKNGREKPVCRRQKSLIIVKYYFPAACAPTG